MTTYSGLICVLIYQIGGSNPAPAPGERITEEGIVRVTEDNQIRITE